MCGSTSGCGCESDPVPGPADNSSAMHEAMQVLLQVREDEWVRECRQGGAAGAKAFLAQLSAVDRLTVSKWLSSQVSCDTYFVQPRGVQQRNPFGARVMPGGDSCIIGRDDAETVYLRTVAAKLKITDYLHAERDKDGISSTNITFNAQSNPPMLGCQCHVMSYYRQDTGTVFGLKLLAPPSGSAMPLGGTLGFDTHFNLFGSVLEMEVGGDSSLGLPELNPDDFDDLVSARVQYPQMASFLDSLGVDMEMAIPFMCMLAGHHCQEILELVYQL